MLTDTAVKPAATQSKSYHLSDERGLFVVIGPDDRHYWCLRCALVGERDPNVERHTLRVFKRVNFFEALCAKNRGLLQEIVEQSDRSTISVGRALPNDLP